MNIQNGVLKIDASFDNAEIETILELIKEDITQIKEVIIDENSVVTSSCLFALLYSIKKTQDDISIPFLDKDNDIESFGNVTFLRDK